MVLKCIKSIAKSMLTTNSKEPYPEGRKHVIPMLFAVLPGIDPNDHQKSIVTMQFITAFLTMIPVVDCSSFCSKFTDMTPVGIIFIRYRLAIFCFRFFENFSSLFF